MSKKKRLKSGFTTGVAAAAAAKGALLSVLGGKCPEQVNIKFLSEGSVTIPIKKCKRYDDFSDCSVIKDAGDDPDITNGAQIGAKVKLGDGDKGNIKIIGGFGVGRITKPGLEVPVGNSAINPGPLKMIENSVAEVMEQFDFKSEIIVEVYVPNGEVLAKKTLNLRLGIVGGISILGTTGIVRPLSHEAYRATIKSALSVAKAADVPKVVITTGRRSEKYAEKVFDELSEEAFVQIGDFFQFSMGEIVELGIKNVVIAVFFGKAVKMAQGIPHTHASKSELTMSELSKWTLETTQNKELSEEIKKANTARHAFGILKERAYEIIEVVGNKISESAEGFSNHDVNFETIIFDFNGEIVFRNI